MKVLVLNYEWPPLGGGASPQSRDISREYVRAGHSVDVVTTRFREQPKWEDDDGMRIRRVRCLRRRREMCSTSEMLSWVLSALPVVRGMLARERHDVIHAHFLLPTGLVAAPLAAATRTPLVLTSHGSDVPGYNRDRFTLEHRLISPWLPRMLARRAAAWVAPSRYLAGLIGQQLGMHADVIPVGIDTTRFAPEEKRPWIVMTGRLLPRKGFQHALAALEGLGGDWEVHLAGDGPMRAELEARARSATLPVHFHGWLPQGDPRLAELYTHGSILVLPSAAENSPSTLLEGMLAGMAVVTSDSTGCAEMVADAGVVVPAGNVARLREALTGLIESDARREALGQAARARVLAHYDITDIGRRYLELFASVVKTEPSRGRVSP